MVTIICIEEYGRNVMVVN